MASPPRQHRAYCSVLAEKERNTGQETFLEELTMDRMTAPNWAKEQIKLGIRASEFINQNYSNNRLTLNLAVSLPTRTYASTFINLGLQIGRRTSIIQSFDQNAHFNALTSLQEDSEVRFYETPTLNHTAKKRIYKGLVEENGEKMISLQDINKPNSRDLVKVKGSYRIIRDDQQRITSLAKIKNFLERVNGQADMEDAISFTLSSSPVTAIIGNNKIIDEENKLTLGYPDSSTNTRCIINEITRLGSQTLLLSNLRDETCDALQEVKPPVVIYESLSAAIKYKDAYIPDLRIFILDRRAPSNTDYRSELKSFYLSREPDPAPKVGISLPGAETVSFYSAF